MTNPILTNNQSSQFLIYSTPDDKIKVDVFIHNENSFVKPTNYYNLDAIISVGYRVNSAQATQFRIWATTILQETNPNKILNLNVKTELVAIQNFSSNDVQNSPLEGWQSQTDGVDVISKINNLNINSIFQFTSPSNNSSTLKEENSLRSWQKNSLFQYWNLPKNKSLNSKARELKKAGVLSEVIFWNTFKVKKILGWDIDRQVVIGNFIVDFWIPELGLIFEIDGCSHDIKGQYDLDRDAFLKNLGLEVVHIEDIAVKKSLDSVVEIVQGSIQKRYLFLIGLQSNLGSYFGNNTHLYCSDKNVHPVNFVATPQEGNS